MLYEVITLEYDGLIGYGEASMPPYLGESHETVAKFLNKVDLSAFNDPFRMDEILEYIDRLEPGNRAAKACVDIALHDLVGKIIRITSYNVCYTKLLQDPRPGPGLQLPGLPPVSG